MWGRTAREARWLRAEVLELEDINGRLADAVEAARARADRAEQALRQERAEAYAATVAEARAAMKERERADALGGDA